MSIQARPLPSQLVLSDSVTRQSSPTSDQLPAQPVTQPPVTQPPVTQPPVIVPDRSVPARAVPRRSVVDLMESAGRSLDAARASTSAGERFVHSHVAALRAGAAIVAARAQPSTSKRARGLPSLWNLLRDIAPELGEWADYFAASAPKRAAAEAGIPQAVSERESDDLLRDSERFVGMVEDFLGFSSQRRIV